MQEERKKETEKRKGKWKIEEDRPRKKERK
jgi:hypothetical protein